MNKFLGAISLCLLSFLGEGNAKEPTYVPRDFSSLLDMPGWNQDLLLMHFTLYQGYVKNTNLILDEMAQLQKKGGLKSFDYGAIKRRFGWEFDGMRLHELYFENLTKDSDKGQMDPSLIEQMKQDFGSIEAWKDDFVATGLIRGIGWVILYKDSISGKLYNVWVNEHDVGHLAEGEILLVTDVFEHAYITQFSLDRGKYMELFFKSLNWEIVNKRWLATCLQSFSDLKSHQNDNDKAQ